MFKTESPRLFFLPFLPLEQTKQTEAARLAARVQNEGGKTARSPRRSTTFRRQTAAHVTPGHFSSQSCRAGVARRLVGIVTDRERCDLNNRLVGAEVEEVEALAAGRQSERATVTLTASATSVSCALVAAGSGP